MRPVEHAVLGERRAALLACLGGQVLELGAGTGANLPHYRDADRVTAAEPDPAMRRRLTGKLGQAAVPVRVVADPAESLGYPAASFDAVVSTCVLCSVTDPDRALREVRRVLRRDGQLLLIEHVRGPGRLGRWQDRLAPLWSRWAVGCHPNRDTEAALRAAGFAILRRETFEPFPRWTLTRPWLEAVAVPAG
jgi:ubiquinone/menaquinone biosynthesis C-methylase UbiE